MATDLSWKDAIVRVLEQTSEAMHYTKIAEEIDSNGLKKTLGATPANTVASQISISRKDEGDNSPFDRVGRGLYRLKEAVGQPALTPVAQEEDVQGSYIIHAYGFYWERQDVDWTSSRLLGSETANSDHVDMSAQIGVYLLYDGREAVYVGRASEDSMGTRLKRHTQDRLKTRWNRFSWFGLYGVDEAGELVKDTSESCAGDVIKALEAVLIEGLEPRQNRQQGEGLKGREYMQVKDPKLARKDLLQQVQRLIPQS